MAEHQPDEASAPLALQPVTETESDALVSSSSIRQFSVDDLGKLADIDNRRNKLRRMLHILNKHLKHERILRGWTAGFILIALFIELIIGNVAFFMVGLGYLHVTKWVTETFLVGMYSQIIAIVTIVVKGLFPAPKSDALSQISEIVAKL